MASPEGRDDLPSGLVDERTFTPWAHGGWSAWNRWSPELEFCQFAGWLQRMVEPAVIAETGVGGRRITDHFDLDDCTWLGFEADPRRRDADCQPDPTPTEEQLTAADLVVLDSGRPYRAAEIALWGAVGKPGSVCLVHDCGNGHKPGSTHAVNRRAVLDTAMPGVFLLNPRGGWLGVHT